MIIRPATNSDIKEISDLARASVEKYFPDFATAKQTAIQADWIAEEEQIASYLGDGLLLVAQVDDRLVGVGGLKLAGPLAWFGMGYVLHEGQGIGSALVEARLQWLQDKGQRFWCCSESYFNNQRAAAHLTRHGFQDTGIRRPSRPDFGSELILWARALIANG